MTRNELWASNEYKFHHSAWANGYIRKAEDGKVEEYHGKFGDGYVVHVRDNKSSRYHTVEYFVK